MEINSRGQAAVTDSLYFLLIVTFLAIFLFGFANTYGNSVRTQVNDEFDTSFATNAMKSILYSSTSRDPAEQINDPDAEIDYLLAMVKEDYADDAQIGAVERAVLAQTINSTLAPIQDTKDYIFTITVPQASGKPPNFVFIFFHTTNFTKQPALDEKGNPLPGRYLNYSANSAKPHIDYFCGVQNYPGPSAVNAFEQLNNKMKRLLTNVGSVSQSSAVIRLLEAPGLATFNAQADLYLWDATWLGDTEESLADNRAPLFYAQDPAKPDPQWGCIEYVAQAKI